VASLAIVGLSCNARLKLSCARLVVPSLRKIKPAGCKPRPCRIDRDRILTSSSAVVSLPSAEIRPMRAPCGRVPACWHRFRQRRDAVPGFAQRRRRIVHPLSGTQHRAGQGGPPTTLRSTLMNGFPWNGTFSALWRLWCDAHEPARAFMRLPTLVRSLHLARQLATGRIDVITRVLANRGDHAGRLAAPWQTPSRVSRGERFNPDSGKGLNGIR